MNWQPIEQRSQEWFTLKAGKISGTRFGECISGRKNAMIYELINEKLDGVVLPTDFVSDDMQFGIDNEETAIALFELHSGIKFERGGVIMSDFSAIHMASPDGVNLEKGIVLEIKCTQKGSKQIQRFFEGVESSYLPQIKNYFACSDSVNCVYWASYCPFRPEKELVVHTFYRAEFEADIQKGRAKIKELEIQIERTFNEFNF